MTTIATAGRARTAARRFWGEPDKQVKVLPGVWWFTTPGHGGFVVADTFGLDPRAIEQRGMSGNDVSWVRGSETVLTFYGFEEDCDWAVLALYHPEVIEAVVRKGGVFASDMTVDEVLAHAKGTAARWTKYPKEVS